MKIKTLIISLALCSLVACEFKKNITTSLTTKGNGLSCKDIYLTIDNKQINRNTFVYGEKFNLNFDNINGFNKENNYAFPGLKLLISNQKGDTIMYNSDLYANAVSGYNISPLLLKTSITVANPINSNNNYIMHINIWDKKGEGTYNAKIDFNVIPNKHIKVKSNTISYKNIYLFSEEKEQFITNNKVKLNENIYLLFEGLEGFKTENGEALIGLSVIAKDSKGKILLTEKDLIGNVAMKTVELNNQVAPFFKFSDTTYTNPIICEVTIWDKRSSANIKTTLNLEVN